jgi:spermidine/putrescine transport system substrate-binding protein
MFTLSDWLARQMYDDGYLYKLDKSALPNVEANLLPSLRHPAADPNRDFTVPWQSGMTGLIVRTDLAPGVDSICDLFNPKYAGKVTMLTELRDSVPMTLKCMGIDPDTATTDQWLSAVDKIKEAADSGQIRRFTGNDYIRELSNGDTAIALGWSGDAVQMQKDNPNIKFVMPKEGCMLWSTSMEIPVGAPDPQGALEWMNYVYDPKVQADIAEWVNYVTPVEGVKEILRKRDPELARNQLIFPSASYTENCTFEPVLGGTQGEQVTKAFSQVVGG